MIKELHNVDQSNSTQNNRSQSMASAIDPITDREKELFQQASHIIENQTRLEVIDEYSTELYKVYIDPNRDRSPFLELAVLGPLSGGGVESDEPAGILETVGKAIPEHSPLEWDESASNTASCEFTTGFERRFEFRDLPDTELTEYIDENDLPQPVDILGPTESGE